MRDILPRRPLANECGIINIDSHFGNGTHWVAYKKLRKKYFDSFGNLTPPVWQRLSKI